jgi:hypothetical protein
MVPLLIPGVRRNVLIAAIVMAAFVLGCLNLPEATLAQSPIYPSVDVKPKEEEPEVRAPAEAQAEEDRRKRAEAQAEEDRRKRAEAQAEDDRRKRAMQFDGTWSVSWSCGTGCNPAKCSGGSYEIHVEKGVISGGRRSGKVSNSGNARWSWEHSGGYGTVNAWAALTGNAGSGGWSNESGCSGHIRARRN